MRDPVALGRCFDLFKHPCAINVLAAPVFLLFLALEPVGGGPFVALVLGAFFASFVFARPVLPAPGTQIGGLSRSFRQSLHEVG